MQQADYVSPPPGALAIPLRARQGGVKAWALVDEADYPWASQFNWHCTEEGYASRNVSPKESGKPWHRVMMHRELLGLERGDKREADHINRDRLDNRRSNLRIATKKQNGQNQGCNRRANRTSKYRGVSYYKQTNRWQAYCRLDGKLNYLGYYMTEEEAAQVAAEFRRLHMPFSEEAA